ncbi:hypothetical protein, partial [Rhizobium sp. CF122]|uniref:hypothetical protein n=1 Tax=Rhizobium sp. CF122 TaxID=1144312 RepID=UPI001AEBF36F
VSPLRLPRIRDPSKLAHFEVPPKLASGQREAVLPCAGCIVALALLYGKRIVAAAELGCAGFIVFAALDGRRAVPYTALPGVR